LRFGLEDEVHKVGTAEMLELVSELALLKTLDLLNGGAFSREGLFEAFDDFFDGFFLAKRGEEKYNVTDKKRYSFIRTDRGLPLHYARVISTLQGYGELLNIECIF
jgi:hypothetical protein